MSRHTRARRGHLRFRNLDYDPPFEYDACEVTAADFENDDDDDGQLDTSDYSDFEVDLLLFGGHRCPMCGTRKPRNSEYFYADPRVGDGLRVACITCELARKRERNRKHPRVRTSEQRARIRERSRERYLTDPDYAARIRARSVERKNELRRAARQKERETQTPEERERQLAHARERRVAYMAAHPELREHKLQLKRAARQRRKATPLTPEQRDRKRERAREYMATHPEARERKRERDRNRLRAKKEATTP